jgi:hypothetical protein
VYWFVIVQLPQRFQYKTHHEHNWRNGICIPPSSGPHDEWTIHAGIGYGHFSEDPWEILGQIIEYEIVAFRWLDNDNDWHPRGGCCCDTVFKTSDDLLAHLKHCKLSR